MTGRASLHIDWTRCQARGACIELLDHVLIADADGFPLAHARPASQRTTIPLAVEDVSAARDAVLLCPRLALSLADPNVPVASSGSLPPETSSTSRRLT